MSYILVKENIIMMSIKWIYILCDNLLRNSPPPCLQSPQQHFLLSFSLHLYHFQFLPVQISNQKVDELLSKQIFYEADSHTVSP